MKQPIKKINKLMRQPKAKIWLKVFLLLALIVGVRQAFATDLLDGTTTDAEDTVQGSGRKWLILADFVFACAAYIKTKNAFVFIGVLVVTIAITTILPAFL